VSVVCC